MAEEDHIKGVGVMQQQAELGMALFKPEAGPVETDKEAAEKFKAEIDVQIKALEVEAAALTGKDNKKARSEKSKLAADLKVGKQYIDATKVIKGLEPKNGFFIKASSAEAIAAKKAAEEKMAVETAKQEAAEAAKFEGKAQQSADTTDKKAKKVQSTGISKAERDELEKLKKDIVERKKALKEQGMSGGQQNKDEQVSSWVARMNELKEKAGEGTADKEKKAEKKKPKGDPEAIAAKQKEIEEYSEKLRTEFKYTAKEIKKDEDMVALDKELKILQGMK